MGASAQLPHSLDQEAALQVFLDHCGWGDADRHFLPGDFSARSYIRLNRGAGDPAQAMVMRMPKTEELSAFLNMQGHLEKSGVRVPAVYAVDLTHALALIEDLGETDLGGALQKGGDTENLYRGAIDILLGLHKKVQNPDASALNLPHFTPVLFLDQVSLFLDLYAEKIMGQVFSSTARAGFVAAWRPALEKACAVPQSLLLRDYHAANIMVPGVAAPLAVIDFQDGGVGPVGYDLVSLLEDARRDIAPALRQRLIDYYCTHSASVQREGFLSSCAILAAQRHMRILAIVARRWVDQGRDEAGDFFKRTWRLLLGHRHEPALAPVFAWLDAHVPEACRESWKR